MIKQKIMAATSTAAPYIMGLVLLGLGLQRVAVLADDAAYAYPMGVIEYGLVDAKTDDDVIARIEKWKTDVWGAQIAALRVVCSRDPRRLDKFGGEQLTARMCRIIK